MPENFFGFFEIAQRFALCCASYGGGSRARANGEKKNYKQTLFLFV